MNEAGDNTALVFGEKDESDDDEVGCPGELHDRLGPLNNINIEEGSPRRTSNSGDQGVRGDLNSRLGPVANLDGPQENAPDRALTVKQKRKPGRPPGRRTVASSPAHIQGASSRKRKAQQTKPPLSRKKATTEGRRVSKPAKVRSSRGEPSGAA
ncbi:hypothetical protein F2Q68_00043657 [Brassica cretica]|uniref:Uncharacterized protein n=1 Tax=Brassica cretica TaxID=69181 RepID=A0A8S9LWM5_BRACR|nr:hypothetical protein F2Q68_00043657 [Brassica cretica]